MAVALGTTRPAYESALNRHSPSPPADVHSAVRVAGKLPTLGGGMRARTRDARGEVV